ncbi:AraC family transcriptional regulator [Curtobacterium sp. MCPF17_047]|nr:AraC family transcriptional regulator [Curtobacterium sp. MCPF17_001]PZF68290.1 AraC family transcriptional regulator [Curtobacterium sp. MCPF17_047]
MTYSVAVMPSPNPPEQPGRSHVRRHDVAGRDIDEATHFYERVHDAHAVRLTQDEDRPFGYRLRAVGDERLRLRSSALSARRWGRIEPQGRYLVTWAHDGELAIDGGADTELVVSAGTPAVYPTGRPFTIEAPPSITLHTIDIDGPALEALHLARSGEHAEPLRFAQTPDPEGLAALQRTLAASTPVLLDPAADRLTRARMVDAVSRRVLDAFAPAPAFPRFPGHPANVIRALDYIEAHLTEPITTADLAAAAGLSQRGLQQAFGRNDLPTPLEALREARLRRARTLLADARPGEVSVAAIARQLGFVHLGRFAGYYAERFGERPSDTLRA